jgi:hypothetical protein
MVQGVAAATSGWGHFPGIGPRFAVGFVLVFAGGPIVWSLHSPGVLVNPNYPFNVFFNYWTWLAVDPNRLWAAAAASVIVGFVAIDLIQFWNNKVNRALQKIRVMNLVRRLVKRPFGENIEAQERSGKAERGPRDASNAKFRIWLFGYENGAPAKYLDWHGLNQELRGVIYHGLWVLCQLWLVWGMFNLVAVYRLGLEGPWMIYSGIEWAGIQIFFGCVSIAAYNQYRNWKSIVRKTWSGLWDVWEDLEAKKVAVSQ